MSKFKDLKSLLKAIDEGWEPPPLPPAETLHRYDLIVQTIMGKILELSPKEEKEIARQMKGAASLAELKPLITRISARAEREWPGITVTLEKMAEKVKELESRIS